MTQDAPSQTAVEEVESLPGAGSSIVRGAGLALIGTAFAGALAFVNEIQLARLLGVESYGLFSLAFVLARIGNGVALFGLGAAVLHFLPIHRDRNEPGKVVGTVLGAILLPAVLGFGSAITLWATAPWMANSFFEKPGALAFIRLIALAVPLMSLSEILALITRGLGFSSYYVLISNFLPPVTLGTLLLVIRLGGFDPGWVAPSVAVAYCAATLVGIACVLHAMGPSLRRVRPEMELRTLYAYSFPVLLGTMLYLIMEWADILLLGHFVSAADVGIYRVCVQVIVLFDMIIFAVNLAASQAFPLLAHQGKRDELNETYRQVTLMVALLSTPVFFMLLIHAGDVLNLLGRDFTAGITVLVMLAAGRTIRNYLGSTAFLLVLSGRQTVETRNAAAAAAANVVLNLAMVPTLGIFGAAVATATAEVALNVLRVWQVRKLMDVHIPWTMLLRIVLTAMGVTAGLWALAVFSPLGQADSRAALLARVMFGGVSFAVGLWFLGIAAKDRQYLMRIIQ